MDRLWAPWRSDYLSKSDKETISKSDFTCFFCESAASIDVNRCLTVAKTQFSIALLNRYPYNTGHILIAPSAHAADLSSLSLEQYQDLMCLFRLGIECIERVYSPNGINGGINLGSAAGAGVPGHLHFHIVPRWNGDANFLTAIGNTRVMSESLDLTFQKISTTFAELLEQ